MRRVALESAAATGSFYSDLFNYIESELTSLGTVNILPEHILLLLSNQLVRICDDMHEFRSRAAGVRLDNLASAATRLGWVTLQSLQCMVGYVKARFRDHPGINSTYLRFLTCRAAASSGVGLKDTLDSVVKRVGKVEKLAADAATKESLTKVDNKVETLVRANRTGGGRT